MAFPNSKKILSSKGLFYSQDNLTFKNEDLNLSSRVDFTKIKQNFQKNKLMLAQAVKIRGQSSLTILDATGGFLQDSMRLALLGHKVTVCEENPYVYLLASDGLRRAFLENTFKPVFDTLKFFHISFQDYLSTTDEKYDVIYLDPMFPYGNHTCDDTKNETEITKNIKKKSKPKKQSQILQFLTEKPKIKDCDLLELALNTAKHKVVVKRAKSHPKLSNKYPVSYQLFGQSTRFDVYSISLL